MSSTATPESQSGSQPGGVLFKLPKELRLQIYNAMLPPGKINLCSIRDHLKLARSPPHPTEDDFGSDLSADDSNDDPDDYSPRLAARDYIAMLATCRAIYDEAIPILYENTHFKIHCSGEARTRCFLIHMKPRHARDSNDIWRSWRDCSPEIDVFHHLQHARSISFNVYLDPHTMSVDPWLQQIPAEISAALNLRKLHISFQCAMNAVYSAEFQAQADHTMALFGSIKCKCPVTVAMETSIGHLGLKGFKTASYFDMLDSLKGTDKTYEQHKKSLAASGLIARTQEPLAKQSSELALKTSELDNIQKDPCWAEDIDMKARVEELTEETQKLSRFISVVQSHIERWRLLDRKIEQRRDLLLAGREALRESV